MKIHTVANQAKIESLFETEFKCDAALIKYFPNRGSISAEHGLGFKKRNFIHFSKSDSAVFLMKQIKQVKKMKINT